MGSTQTLYDGVGSPLSPLQVLGVFGRQNANLLQGMLQHHPISGRDRTLSLPCDEPSTSTPLDISTTRLEFRFWKIDENIQHHNGRAERLHLNADSHSAECRPTDERAIRHAAQVSAVRGLLCSLDGFPLI